MSRTQCAKCHLHLLSKHARSMNCHTIYIFHLRLDYILGQLRTAVMSSSWGSLPGMTSVLYGTCVLQ